MGLLKHLLFWPVTGPTFLARFAVEKVGDTVRRELTDDQAIREELLELQMRLELGEIDDDEYLEAEAALMQRLREVRAWREEFGMATPGGPVRVAVEPDAESEAVVAVAPEVLTAGTSEGSATEVPKASLAEGTKESRAEGDRSDHTPSLDIAVRADSALSLGDAARAEGTAQLGDASRLEDTGGLGGAPQGARARFDITDSTKSPEDLAHPGGTTGTAAAGDLGDAGTAEEAGGSSEVRSSGAGGAAAGDGSVRPRSGGVASPEGAEVEFRMDRD